MSSDVLFVSVGECAEGVVPAKKIMSAFAGSRTLNEIVDQYHPPPGSAMSPTLQVCMSCGIILLLICQIRLYKGAIQNYHFFSFRLISIFG